MTHAEPQVAITIRLDGIMEGLMMKMIEGIDFIIICKVNAKYHLS